MQLVEQYAKLCFFSKFSITSCSREERYQVLSRVSILQAMKSWAGPGNKARKGATHEESSSY